MHIRPMKLDDYEEVVDMFYRMYKEMYSGIRKVNPKYFFYRAVYGWINDKKHVIIAEKDGVICGFTMSYVDDFGGLTEPVYNGEIAYIKPEFRKTRAAYLLYNNGMEYARELGMNAISSSRVENGVDKMIEKHYQPKKMFVSFEKEL